VCLPAKLASSLGGLGPLVLITRVTNAITLTDPCTLRGVAIDVRLF
jgi:nonsense-mediated mRNA decay protein 3